MLKLDKTLAVLYT